MLRRHNKVRLSRRGGIFKDDLRFLDGITASEGVSYQDRKMKEIQILWTNITVLSFSGGLFILRYLICSWKYEDKAWDTDILKFFNFRVPEGKKT